MHNKLKSVVAASIVVFLAGCAQEPPDPLQSAFKAIDQVVRTAMDETGTPGLALAITNEDKVLYEGYYGFADLRHRTPVNDETLFQIGSISKSFTALALMHLWDEGLFDPQRPIDEYLPWWEVQTRYEPITGHHLLTHTAGIPANRDDIPGGRATWHGRSANRPRPGRPVKSSTTPTSDIRPSACFWKSFRASRTRT